MASIQYAIIICLRNTRWMSLLPFEQNIHRSLDIQIQERFVYMMNYYFLFINRMNLI